MHAVEDEPDEVESLEGGRLPRGELRPRLRDKPPAHGALAGPAAHHRGRHRLQAAGVLPRGHTDQHLFDDTPIQRIRIRHGAKRRQHDFVPLRTHAGTPKSHLAASQHDFTRHGAGSGRDAIGLMLVARAAGGGAIVFQHRGEHP
jgi:hypothetical protein